MEKRDAARALYLDGWNQADIARALKISEQTVSKWSSDAKWKQLKVSRLLIEDNSVQRLYEIIDYQTTMLKRKKDQWLSEDPEGKNIHLIERGDIDALQKLFSCIKKEAHNFSAYATVLKELLEFAQAADLELAKQLTAVGDAFLQHKQTSM